MNAILTDRQRRDKFLERYRLYNGDLQEIVTNRILEIYPKANLIGLLRQIDLTQNPYKNIVSKISRVYAFGVERVVKNKVADELLKKLRWDKYLKEANRLVNALNDIILQVAIINGEPKILFRYPHTTRVEVDENNEPISVEYLVGIDEEAQTEKWAYWSKDEHYYKIYSINSEEVVNTESINQGDKNPFGVLPFVFIQKGFRDAVFWDMYSGDDMTALTKDVCSYNTFKNYLIKWQSFKQLIVTGSNLGVLQGQLLDPATALTVEGEDTKIDLLDLQSDLKQLRDTINDAVTQVAINYNISPSQFMLSGEVPSGISLKILNSALDEFTVDQQKDFELYEKELFEILKIVTRLNLGELGITIKEPSYPVPKGEEVDIISKEIDLGLIKVSDIIAKKRGITEEEAKKVLEDNLKERNKIYNKVEEPAQPNIEVTGLE